MNTNFLDTNIKIQNNSFIITLYDKPTDKRLCVLSDSCHPTHQKTSIAYSQSLRLRICTHIEDYNTHTDLLKSALDRRRYTTPNIDTVIEKARCPNRSELIKPSSARMNPNHNKTLYFVTTSHQVLIELSYTAHIQLAPSTNTSNIAKLAENTSNIKWSKTDYIPHIHIRPDATGCHPAGPPG